MGFDLSEFLDMFYEEVEEHVKTLERIFLSMHVNARVDNESINEAFRAAHSIKGGAATFDMADISSLSHALESVLDKMRHGHVSLDASLVNLFMKTLDEIRYLLSSRIGNEPSDARASARLVEDLNAVMSLQPPEKKRIRVEDLAIEGKDYGFFKKEIPSVAPLEEMADSDERKTRQVLLESNSIRVSVQKVDELVDLVGEFIITQSMLEEAARAIESEKSEKLMRVLGAMKKRSSELQNAVLSIRMLPLQTIFERLKRVVHDVSQKLDKKIELRIDGGETEIDKGMIEHLADPLTHLIRNCADHGIERLEERLAKQKPETGLISLRAFHEGGSVVVEVSDDGKGLDRLAIIKRAKEKGLVKDGEQVSDERIHELIMAPGFSTASSVTDISGRGVGMDVVKRNIEHLGGRIHIQSVEGQGTTFTLRLPLTLAIIDGMKVAVGSEVYVIPLASVMESKRPSMSDIRTIASDGLVLKVRDEYLPMVHLAELFSIHEAKPVEKSIAVIVDVDGERAAIMVDDLLGQTQVVVKSLSKNFRKIAGFSGATILGNGNVTLILDCASLMAMRKDKGYAHA